MSAMLKLVKYLHQKLKLQYVLPAKFTSDPIENHFSWCHKAKGRTFFYADEATSSGEKKFTH